MSEARFLTPLRVEKVGREWRLLAPLVFSSAVLGAEIEVPEGFLTDFASVPRAPLAYWLAGNTGHEAATLHDWLYRNGLLTRSQCDLIFREALLAMGEPLWRAELMYLAVLEYGGPFYRGAPDPPRPEPVAERTESP